MPGRTPEEVSSTANAIAKRRLTGAELRGVYHNYIVQRHGRRSLIRSGYVGGQGRGRKDGGDGGDGNCGEGGRDGRGGGGESGVGDGDGGDGGEGVENIRKSSGALFEENLRSSGGDGNSGGNGPGDTVKVTAVVTNLLNKPKQVEKVLKASGDGEISEKIREHLTAIATSLVDEMTPGIRTEVGEDPRIRKRFIRSLDPPRTSGHSRKSSR